MSKHVSILLLLIGLTTTCLGQKTFILSLQDKRGFVAVTAGGNMPIGAFGSRTSPDQKAGMAAPGLTLSVSAGFRALERFGLMAQATQHRNAIQTDALLGAVYHAATDVWTVKADNWNITTFMAGPYITVPKGRFSIDGHLLAGWAQATMPNTAMAGTIGTTTMSVQTTGSQTGGLAFGAGAGLRYRLCPDLSATINADYSYSQLTFNNLTSRAVSSNGVSESLPYSSDRQIGLVSVSVGLAFLFGNSNRPF
ncbi:hypothetical protein GCM10027578_43000 [Spirosoma luteolum]